MQTRQAVPSIVVALLATILAGGCAKPQAPQSAADPPETYKPQTVDPWLVEASTELSARNAVVRQHTLFPYEFVEYGAALNDLGRRDLDILINHYKQYPGPLNIRQGDAPASLYQARIATVRDALAAAGVNVQQVNVADAPPGGDGLAGEHVLVILSVPSQVSTPGRTVSVSPFTIQQGPSK